MRPDKQLQHVVVKLDILKYQINRVAHVIKYYYKKECSNICATCSVSDTNCTTCANGRENAPACTCSGNTYDDGTNCVACSSICVGCKSSATNCTACASGRENAPTCSCIAGTYDDNGTCTACPTSCATCSKDNTGTLNCLTCAANRNTAPTCNCDSSYFESTGSCISIRYYYFVECNYKCLECQTSDTNCLTCSDANRESAPACSCKAGYFEVSNTAACSSTDVL